MLHILEKQPYRHDCGKKITISMAYFSHLLEEELLQNASKGSELAASGCKTWDLEFQLPKKLFRKVPVKM